MGEYHICVSDSHYLHTIWTDGRNGDDNDLYYSRALLSELNIEEQEELVSTTQRMLKIPTIWRGNVTLEILQNSHPIEIKAYDVTGRLINDIYSGDVPHHSQLHLASSKFPAGVIFIKISSDDVEEVHKIVNLGGL